MPKDYPTGFDSAFASDADYRDGFRASDKTIAEVAARRNISLDAARGVLGASPMDRLNRMLEEDDDTVDGPDAEGPEY